MALYNYQIVSGWDSAGSLANIETIAPPGAPTLSSVAQGIPLGTYYMVKSIGRYRRNESADLEGGVTQQGYASTSWEMDLVSAIALDYFLQTYAQDSSNYGQCTIKTRVRQTATYANYNAIVRLNFKDEFAIYRSGYYWYLNTVINITLKEAL